MTTEPFKLDIAESFIDVKPRSDSFLDLPETDVDKLIDKDETKKEQSDALGSATFGSEVTSASEGLTEEQKNLLSDAEQFLRDEATKVSPFPEISTAKESAIAKAGTNNGAAKILDNVNNDNKNTYLNNVSNFFNTVGGGVLNFSDRVESTLAGFEKNKEELRRSGMGPVVAGVTGGPLGAVMAFAPLVADGFQQKKDMNKFLKEFGEKGFSDELLNSTYAYGSFKNQKTGREYLNHVLINDFNPGHALKYNAYGGKQFNGNHHDALKKFIVDGVNEDIFNEGAILRLASQRYNFKAGSDAYWKATVAQRALADLGYTVKGRTAIDSAGNTYLDGKLWKKAVDTNVPQVVSAGTSSNTGQAQEPTQTQTQVTGGGGADQDTSPSVSDVMTTDFVTKDTSYYENFNKPGGGYDMGYGLAFGGEPEPKANIGNLEFINERGKDMSGVADDVERPLEEGDFVINAPAVEFAGKKDIEDMLEEAIAIAMARGFDISDERKGKLLTGLSNRELVIPKVLAEIIGYDRLNKINNRGKERVQEIVQARKEETPDRPINDDPRLRAQSGGAIGSVLDSDVATGKLAAAGAPGEILSTPRGAFVNIAKPMPTAQVLQQTPIGEEILRPQSMMNVGGDVDSGDVKVEIKKKPKITQFELVRNNLSSSPYKLRNEAIAAILGNIAVETGETFNYKISQTGGPGRGLFQFEGGHSRAYEDYKKANNLSPSIDAQVSYVLDNIYKGTGYDIGIKNRKDLQNIFATGTTSEIAKSFAEIFERPNPEKAKYDKRIQRANEIYDMLYRPNPQKSFPLTMSKEDALREIDETKPVIGTGLLN